jgi:hypothetical protein
MNKSHSNLLGLAIAVALTTGAQMVQHPSPSGEAPGAYGDITIAEADNQKLPPEGTVEKGVPAPQSQPPQAQKPAVDGGEVVGEGQKNKGVPPAAAVSPDRPSDMR